MEDGNKTKKQLIDELQHLRKQCAEQKTNNLEYSKKINKLCLFKTIVESSQEAISLVNSDGRLVYINPAYEKLYSRTLQDTLLNYKDYRSSESVEIFNKQIVPKLSHGESWEGELDSFDANGNLLTHWEHVDPIKDGENELLYSFRISHDMSEKKRAEEFLEIEYELALELSRSITLTEAFQYVLEAICRIPEIDCGGIYLVDKKAGTLALAAHMGLTPQFVKNVSNYKNDSPQYKLVIAGNPYYSRNPQNFSFGEDKRRQEGLRAFAIIPVKYQGEILAVLNLASHSFNEIPESTRHFLEVIALRIGGLIRRAKGQTKLIESQKNLQNLFHAIKDFLFILDYKGNIIYCNPVVERCLGYSRDELTRMKADNIHQVDTRDQFCSIIDGVINNKIDTSTIPLLTKIGTTIPVETKFTLGVWDDQNVIISISRDIAERKLLEDSLQKAHSELDIRIQERTTELTKLNNKLQTEIQHRRSAEEINTNNIADLEILSETAIGFVALHPEDDVYSFIGKQLKKICGDAIIILNSFNPVNKTFYLKHIDGLGRQTDKIITLLGRQLDGFSSTLNNEEAYRELLTGKIVIVNGGLYELSFHEIPNKICKSIEKLLGIKNIYAMGMSRNNQLFGNVVILTKQKSLAFTIRTLETFINQAAVALERKRAEEALVLSKEKFRLIFEQSPVAVELYDSGGNLINVNVACLTMFGVTQIDELTGFNLFTDPNISDVVKDKILNGDSVKYESIFDFEIVKQYHLYETSRSGAMNVDVFIHPLRLNQRSPYGYLVYARDITARKQAEQRIIESEKKYHALFEAAGDAIFAYQQVDQILNVTDCNTNAARMFGYTREQIIGKSPLQLSDQIQRNGQNSVSSIQDFTTRVMNGEQLNFEWLSQRADGKIFDSEVTLKLVEIGEKQYIQAIVRDITERKKLEQEIIKTAKLESLGVLAGGIAHDFNNMLTGIFGNISLARMCKDSWDEVDELLDEAEKAAAKTRNLTQQLLTFAKGGSPVKKMMAIKDLVKDNTTFALRGTNIKCEFTIADDLNAVEMDEGQISQVLNNLIINAIQAMPHGGIINITGENLNITKTNCLPLSDGKYVKISICDHGTGISSENLTKIFDPYFTTKEKGSGLGLATAFSIIKKHGGYLAATSKVGLGSTFSFYLPALANNLGKMTNNFDDQLFVGHGKILVMDDDSIVRRTIGKILTQLGFSVEYAQDGKQALDIYSKALKSRNRFDIVIMDLTIPGGMGGKETVRKLLEIDPHANAIVSSGYSNDPVVSEYQHYGFRDFIPKPYSTKELIKVLHRVLASNSSEHVL
ncbi:PAS domain S-box protein [candidate division KSB1 bacterium]|nr:PAS domain S-box protein [candidate division KSB1 bacterium]